MRISPPCCSPFLERSLSCFPANSCPPKIKFARKKGHSTKERNHCQLVSFFYVMPFEDNDPAPTLPLGVTAQRFSARYNLYGIASRLLYSYLTQSNHKSALLFSCTRPFSGACGYYTTFFLKNQTYVHIILRKIKNFSELCTMPKEKGRDNKQKHAAALQRKPARRERKRRSASGSARTPFRGGHFCRCVFFLCRPFGNGGLNFPFERLRFS